MSPMLKQIQTTVNQAAAIPDFNEAVKFVQNALDIESGDTAGIFFSDLEIAEIEWIGLSEDAARHLLSEYIAFEILHG